MRRCEADTASGNRCLNDAIAGKRFCRVHRDRLDKKRAAWVTAGALFGNALVPGLGGAAGGGLAGWAADRLVMEDQVAKKRVFVSFDFDNDRTLKAFIIGQAKLPDSPFEVVDCSLKEAAPMKTWEEKARKAIKGSDLVLVMVGEETHRASGVLKEVAMAREEGVKIVQIIGYSSGNYTAVPNAGRLYAWNWDNLKKLLA